MDDGWVVEKGALGARARWSEVARLEKMDAR